MKEKEHSNLLPFFWTTNKSHSFDSYLDCLAHWEQLADQNRSLDLYELFQFDKMEQISGEKNRQKKLEVGDNWVKYYEKIE